MEKLRRSRILFVLAGAVAAVTACNRTSEPNQVSEVRSAATATAQTPEQAAAAAHRARQDARARYMSLKSSLNGRLVDDPERQALDAQLHEALSAATEYPLAPVAGSNLAAPDPDLAGKMETLRAKMRDYDMNKPEDAAAWATLKAKELAR